MQINKVVDGGGKLLKSGHDLKYYLGMLSPLIAILISFMVSGLVVLISGGDPIEAYASLLRGAFGSLAGIENTIRFTIPLVLLALSFAICDRCGYFNIGQEGQMVAAALAVTWVPLWLPTAPAWAQMALMIVTGALAAGIMALIPAVFKFLLGIDEVVLGVLINYILVLLASYALLYTPIADANASVPMSKPIEPAITPVLAVVAVIVIILGYAILMQNTVPGYQLRMIGKNVQFAKACGIPSMKIVLSAVLIGGVLSGIASIGEVLGVYHKMYDGFAAGMGFNGITAALIGKETPAGMVLGALMLGALQGGSVLLSVETNTPAEMVQVVQGFIMFFATLNVLNFAIKRRR